MNKKQNFKNIFLVLLSQFFSIGVSLILGFVVPKIIDEYTYSYWQTFLLYYGYASVFSIGLVDGFFLRYSKFDIDELPQSEVRSFFRTLLVVLSFFSIIITVIGILFFMNEYRMITILVGAGVLIHNLWAFNYVVLNTTNRLNEYAKFVFIQRFIYLLLVILLLVWRINDFVFYCVAELCAELLAFVFSCPLNKGLYFGKCLSLKDSFKQTKLNISCGMQVLLANFSGNFLVLGSKTIIQFGWSELVFGKISFGFSVSNLFLSLIFTVSTILFPSIKRMNEDDLPYFYIIIRKNVPLLIFLCLLFYFPLCKVLALWLPKYTESLSYLGILLPVIFSISLTNLLTNNYFKAYRKEKMMLIINLSSVFVAVGLYLIFAFIINDLYLVLICVVVMSFLRLFISELFICRILKIKMALFGFFSEIFLSFIFIFSSILDNFLLGSLIYLASFSLYLLINRKTIKKLLSTITYYMLSKKNE